MPGLQDKPSSSKKRKLEDNPEIEIDVSAPEPPSKKALRKAKKQATASGTNTAGTTTSETPAEKSAETPQETQLKNPKQRSEYGIWIGNLPFSATKDEVRKFFASHCSCKEDEILRVHMPEGPKQRGKSQNKGFAYVDFKTKEILDGALAASEKLLSGRRVLIKNAGNFVGRPDKPKETAENATPTKPPSNRIFVGNLSFDVTNESLEEHFKPCGNIVHLHMATFEDSGKCKGYAWVEFEEVESAESAVRGFVKVPEKENSDEDEDDSDADETKASKPKKQKFKKIWVNRISGRLLRMEFAEDKTTRYNKRYGGDKAGKGGQSAPIVEAEAGENQKRSTGRDSKPRRPDQDKREEHATIEERAPRKQKRDYTNSRYSKDTVERLSGAIVESQGKKITFD
jgi:RNA recognition motif-containing protein